MNKFEAEKVVKEYGKVIADNKAPILKVSLLPHPKPVIKQAFFIYIEAIVKDYGTLSKDRTGFFGLFPISNKSA